MTGLQKRYYFEYYAVLVYVYASQTARNSFCVANQSTTPRKQREWSLEMSISSPLNCLSILIKSELRLYFVPKLRIRFNLKSQKHLANELN